MREDLIEAFYSEFGYMPSEKDLIEYAKEYSGYQNISFIDQDYKRINPYNSGEGALLYEFKEIFNSIASSARKAVKKGSNNTTKSESINEEVKMMLLLFVAKSFLFFVLKEIQDKEFSFLDI